MKEMAGLVAREKEFQDGFAGGDVKGERAIHKLELLYAGIEQALHVVEQCWQRNLAHRNVERRQTKLAGERTTARRLDVDDAMRDVVFSVEIVRQDDPGKVRQFSGDGFWKNTARRSLAPPFQQYLAHFAKLQIRFAGDDVVGKFNNGLAVRFIADLRAAENDFDVRAYAFDGGDDFRGGRDVPDVNTEADDLGIAGEQHFRDVQRTLVDVELDQAGVGAQRTQVGHEITQAERGMDVFRVEGG